VAVAGDEDGGPIRQITREMTVQEAAAGLRRNAEELRVQGLRYLQMIAAGNVGY
jgi:hypothetical protein